jgi:glycosyltransferase involved in cell wall biosynthesis
VVDIDYFVPKSTDNSEFIFAAAATLIPIKRFDLLIRAFAKAFRGQAVRLLIGGEGRERNSIQSLITKLDVANQVELLGYLSHQQVLELFQKADAVVSASDVETFGVTLIEAMSCGNPVIATRSGGPEDFITDEVGLLVPCDNLDALSQAMLELYQNYDDYNAMRIREYCIEKFSEASIVRKLETIYQQLLEN